MFEAIINDLKTFLAILLIIILTHGIFFMAYGYFMEGDPLIALKNFYNVMYYLG